jgi:tight adherence protein C
MDITMLIVIACGFGAVMLVGFALHPSSETTSISQRLEGLKTNQQQRGPTSLRDQDEMNKSAFVRVILPLLDKFSAFFTQLTPATSLDRAKKSIVQAGLQGKVTPLQIASLSYCGLILVPFLSLISFAGIPTELMSKSTLMLVFGALLGYRLPYGYVQGKAKARTHEILKALPFTLDLLSISVEAGMALDGAMAIVQEKSKGPMADELGLTLREIRLGKGRNEALVDMAERVNLDELKAFITAVTYIARLGGSLVDVIRIQANAMRIKRRQRAEEKAMKTPVKIMIPLVLFIFPSMFIVILGPAAITMVEQMSQVPGH